MFFKRHRVLAQQYNEATEKMLEHTTNIHICLIGQSIQRLHSTKRNRNLVPEIPGREKKFKR